MGYATSLEIVIVSIWFCKTWRPICHRRFFNGIVTPIPTVLFPQDCLAATTFVDNVLATIPFATLPRVWTWGPIYLCKQFRVFKTWIMKCGINFRNRQDIFHSRCCLERTRRYFRQVSKIIILPNDGMSHFETVRYNTSRVCLRVGV